MSPQAVFRPLGYIEYWPSMMNRALREQMVQ